MDLRVITQGQQKDLIFRQNGDNFQNINREKNSSENIGQYVHLRSEEKIVQF